MELQITNPSSDGTASALAELQTGLLRSLGVSLDDIEHALDRRRRREVAARQVAAHVEKGGRVL